MNPTVLQSRLSQQIKRDTNHKLYYFLVRVYGHKFLIMSDLLTTASGYYSEFVKYFSKCEHIHLSHKFEDLGENICISFKFP